MRMCSVWNSAFGTPSLDFHYGCVFFATGGFLGFTRTTINDDDERNDQTHYR